MVTPKAMQTCLLLLLCSGTAMAKMSRWERVLQAGADATVAQAPAVAPAAAGVSSGPLVRGVLCIFDSPLCRHLLPQAKSYRSPVAYEVSLLHG